MKNCKLSVLLLVLLLLFSFAGCGKSADNKSAGYAADVPKNEIAESPAYKSDTSLPDNRKLIQTVNMNVEVQELNSALTGLESRIAEQGGYVENSNIHHGSSFRGSTTRSASMTVRIPADKLSGFLTQVSDISNVVSSNKSVEDVTLNYVATESRLNALKTEETRLLELLAQAQDMNDLLTIEKRLTEVRTELEQVASTLKVYDNQVDYATVHLDITEVKEYTVTEEPKTVGQRISTGFVNSAKSLWKFLVELFVIFIVSLPWLLIIGGFIFAVVFLIRKIEKRSRAKRKAAITPPPAPPKTGES